MVRVATVRKVHDDTPTSRSCSSKPPWLLSSLSDLDEKIRVLVQDVHEDEEKDTFAQRAESYYRQRPQLLLLLQELYGTYVSLADRYSQYVSKHHHHLNDEIDCYRDIPGFGDHGIVDSDAESAISYQPQSSLSINLETAASDFNVDVIIAELVIKSVEYDLMEHELNVRERRFMETSRKIELQKSLLEVLESERLILLNENARLEYKVGALVEENKGLAADSMFMKRKARELARCMQKMRDDHRVLLLSRKIEDLQGQIFCLEKRNKEYYDQLVKKSDHERMCCSSKQPGKGIAARKVGGRVAMAVNTRGGHGGSRLGEKAVNWWEQVKNFNFFPCGPQK
ncbi:hypothetical protein Dimus_003687 [Dionaea muscipula]